MNNKVYIKLNQHSKVEESRVFLKDVAEIFCEDKKLLNRLKVLPVVKFSAQGERKVISVFYLMDKISGEFPGITFENVGENDVIVEWEKPKKGEWFKVCIVSLIAFFGTAFTIMAFHNDVGIREVFEEIYKITGSDIPDGLGILEVSYCLGLFAGVTIFFNHIGKKKITSDPTPVSVAMHNYEKDVNQSVIENAERQGVELK